MLLTTILGFVLEGDPDLQANLVDSTLAELPLIGSQLREDVHSLEGSGVGLAVGILGTLYGCLGAAGLRCTGGGGRREGRRRVDAVMVAKSDLGF